MPSLDALPPEQAAALAELTARLKHDLGKYVAFGARWLPPDAPRAERVGALTDDLLRTRRGPDGTRDALAVWAPYRRVLTGQDPLATGPTVDLTGDPDLARIVQAMAGLAPVIDTLRAGGSLPDGALDNALNACREVSAACRDLHRRAHAASRSHG